MSRAPGKYVAGTMAPAGAALDRPDLEEFKSVISEFERLFDVGLLFLGCVTG
jgi:hypothetical protein